MIISDYEALKSRIWDVSNRLSPKNNKTQSIEASVKEIIHSVADRGFEAVKELTQKFDKVDISEPFISTQGHFAKLSSDKQEAIKLASVRIKRFQEELLPEDILVDYGSNDKLGITYRPMESVGLYVPGGNAPLLSTVMMTAIPAQVAGVKEIILCSPPKVHEYILAVADYLGIERVLQIGGAQAVAAMAYGLPEIGLAPVDKICGPGNAFVTYAKKEVLGQVGIDALYGPSELLIIADEHADPKAIVCDLMSQLEHGSGLEATCLLTDSQSLADRVLAEFDIILAEQPNKESIQKAWNDYGIIGVTQDLKQAIELSNIFAPEHLELKIKNSESYVEAIQHAGAIFLDSSNEALGDYLAGPSHCLPTGRSARFSSGLSVHDFLKRSSLVQLKPNEELVKATALLARMEGLEAHAKAAEGLN